MELYTNSLVWLLLAPLLLALAIFATAWLGRSARLVELLHLASVSAVLVLTLIVLQSVLANQAVHGLNGWLLVDGLAAVFLLIVAVVGFLVGWYSLGYIRQELKTGALQENQLNLYYGLFSLFLFTMLLVVTANNIIMMWVAVEATTLGSAFLVGIYNKRSALEAAWKYVIICTVGVAFGLYGTVLVYSDAVNVLNHPGDAVLWTRILENAAALDPTLLKLAFVFVLIGFGTKAGIFPMHAWLPDAHSEAPSPVSALLSGVLLNCALFVVIRFAIILNQAVGPEFTQNIFRIFGAVSVIAAVLFMYVQRDIKRLLAYSSVENIGLIVLALGIGGPAGTLAALLHAINHGLVKALMFCTSGNLLLKYHSRDLGRVRGVIQAAPVTSLLLTGGAMALAGTPPFNIFLSKFWIISAGFGAGYGWWMLLSILALAVAFAAFYRAISASVFGELPQGIEPGEYGWSTLVPVGVLLLLALLLGVYLPPQLASLLNGAAQVALSGQAYDPTAGLFVVQGGMNMLQIGFSIWP